MRSNHVANYLRNTDDVVFDNSFLETGFESIDREIGGFKYGSFIILGGGLAP